jgi:peptide/nickel transport system substrate-binding protein
MMPKRIAETDHAKQISEFVGSGPFVFVKDEWKPNDRVVYVKNTKYKARPEPASWLAGGKVVNVDRVEWRAISDPQQAVNALVKNEIDVIEAPAHDLFPLLKQDAGVALLNLNPYGNQYAFRANHLHKPLDNPKVRQALWHALNQKDFLDAVIGDATYYKLCKSIYICQTALETPAGMTGLLESNFARARDLLKEAGYDGAPIVLMHPTDLNVLANLAPVAKSLMEKAGFKVEMYSADWQTIISRVSKKDPPDKGGWGALITSWNAGDILDPVMSMFLNSDCEKSRAGWPCDPTMEKLRDDFARAVEPGEKKRLAEAVQQRAIEWTQYIPLGQWYSPMAARKNVTGLLPGPVPVFWNVRVEK